MSEDAHTSGPSNETGTPLFSDPAKQKQAGDLVEYILRKAILKLLLLHGGVMCVTRADMSEDAIDGNTTHGLHLGVSWRGDEAFVKLVSDEYYKEKLVSGVPFV